MPFDGTDSPLPALALLTDMEKLIRRGWVKGRFALFDTHYCLIGALNKAQGRHPCAINDDHPDLHDDTANLILDQINEITGKCAIFFNDHKDTDKAEVLRVLGQVRARLTGEYPNAV